MIKHLGNLVTVSISCAFLGIVSGAMLGGLFGLFLYYGYLFGSPIRTVFYVPLIALVLGGLGGLMAGLIGGSFSGLPGFWIGGLIGGVFSAAILPPHNPPAGLIYIAAAVGALFGLWADWQMTNPSSRFPLIRRCQAVFNHCSVADSPLWLRYGFGAVVSLGCVFLVLGTLSVFAPQRAPDPPAHHLTQA